MRAVNGALGRLDAAFASQRQFTADAAHELRTPIAVLRARVDALPENSTSRALRRDLDRLGRLAEQLLTVSVLDSRAFDLDADVDVGAITRGLSPSLRRSRWRASAISLSKARIVRSTSAATSPPWRRVCET